MTVSAIAPLFARIDFKTLAPEIEKIKQEQIKAAQAEMPYSYPQLTRIFKKYMRCTITQYVNKTKLQYAKELLANTDMSLTEITNELHFESTSHFHSLFKKHFNITPNDFRKNHK